MPGAHAMIGDVGFDESTCENVWRVPDRDVIRNQRENNFRREEEEHNGHPASKQEEII